MNTKKKIVLITGGSRGLGKDMALNMAKNKMDVIITYNNDEVSAKNVVSQLEALGVKAQAFKLNIAHAASIEPFIEEVTTYLTKTTAAPYFDYLINNAGTALYSPFCKVETNQIEDIFNIHYKGPLLLTQKALPYMKDGGGIINISSGLTRFTIEGSSVYASIKAAIEVLTRYQAKELGARKIRANVIAPGAIETDFGDGHVRDNKEINQMVAESTALGRAGLPTDIGGVAAFLCSEAAYWINGQRIEVSGGVVL